MEGCDAPSGNSRSDFPSGLFTGGIGLETASPLRRSTGLMCRQTPHCVILPDFVSPMRPAPWPSLPGRSVRRQCRKRAPPIILMRADYCRVYRPAVRLRTADTAARVMFYAEGLMRRSRGSKRRGRFEVILIYVRATMIYDAPMIGLLNSTQTDEDLDH